jgi:cobalt-zinc-cadmium resistance protein CzcA
MFKAILRASVRDRHAVIVITLLLAIGSALSFRYLVVDAVPDITNIQVQINTEAPGYSPFETERRITQPLELMLAGLPSLEYTRSLSRYGLSQVTAVFRDKTDIYFARQLIAQRIQESKDRLPVGINPSMGPIATGLGEISMFTIENDPDSSKQHSLQELREIQDWVVRPQLRTVPGVVEINSIGGVSKQIVVTPDLNELRAYHLTLDDLSRSIGRNNTNVGAGFVEQNGEQLLIRVPAQVQAPSELEGIVVGVHDGIPVSLRNVAHVEIGSELRTGAATQNGREVVLGTVFMLKGENGRVVSERVSKKLQEIARSVPEGVVVRAVYNRSDLVNATITTVRKNLFEGALLVIVVLFLALGNIRAALITAFVIPLSMGITIFGMVQGKLSANLMSLGALDFGLIVDGAVILVENCIRRIARAQAQLGRVLSKEERLEVVCEASSEVRQATMFGELIIMIVYIPILALSGIEGKMFHPMALTVLLALGAAFVLSLTFVPAAVAVFVTGHVSEHGKLMARIERSYTALLKRLIRHPQAVFTLALMFFLSTLALSARLGAEFIPSLDEGDIALHAMRVPGTSLTQSIAMQHQLENVIKKIPEVREVLAKIGTAEIATDPMPPSIADGYVLLKPRKEWKDPHKRKEEVVAELESLLHAVPGNNYEFTQPIQMRFNELIAGVRSDIAVKVFGDDTEVLGQYGEQVRRILQDVEGASDVKLEQTTGLPMVTIRPDRMRVGRLGLNSEDIQDAVSTAYAGKEVSTYFEGDRNFPIVVRLSDDDRHDVKALAQLPISLPQALIPSQSLEQERVGFKYEAPERPYVALADVAEITTTEGPNQISRENGKRRVVVTANVRGRDLASFVTEVQLKLRKNLDLPHGYWLGMGGQYEHLISARARLMLVVPLVLVSVFVLIFITFRSFTYTFLVFSGVPFALSGGIVALWMRDIPFSISAAVGFIALSGVSVLNGLVLVSFTRKLLADARDTTSAIIEGAVSRVRPVLMTALVASLGFVPMAISHGTGSEVQRPLATVVIGGIVSSTLLTLLVLPVLISIFASFSKDESV